MFRFYGDMNGDASVELGEFDFFSLVYLDRLNYNAAPDFNNDGRINVTDFGSLQEKSQIATTRM